MSCRAALFVNRGVLGKYAVLHSLMNPVPVRHCTIKDIYGYTTKKKRLDKSRETSMAWAKPILDRKDEEEHRRPENDVLKEPHMLHVVYLIKPTKGRPWWEKDIVEKLGLEGKLHQPVILKNIPSVNKQLDEVKHLIKIQPLMFPNGIPENESDWEHSRINSLGEMVVVQRLEEFEMEGKYLPDPEKEKWSMDLDTLKTDLDKQMRDYNVHTEYFKAQYTYRRNQDGKEYRYQFNKGVPKYER